MFSNSFEFPAGDLVIHLPERDADRVVDSRELRMLCSKVGVEDAERVISSVESETRLDTWADCFKRSVEVFNFGSLPRASRRVVFTEAGEELPTTVASDGDAVDAVSSVLGGFSDGNRGVEAKLLRVDVESGTRGSPFLALPLRARVLNAGGEDWKADSCSSAVEFGFDDGAVWGSAEESS
jgi:hypothetical protein